jgi:hypothetical protein
MISQELIEKMNAGNSTPEDAQEFQRALGAHIDSLKETDPTEYLAFIQEVTQMVSKTNEILALAGE